MAAFTAAVLSLVSVIISVVLTYRLSSRAQLERWRQDEERPIVARLLRLSNAASGKWLDVNDARLDWVNSLTDDPSQNSGATNALNKAIKSWEAGSELYEKLGFEAAQLDLIAGRPLRDVTAKLVHRHWTVMIMNHPQAERDDWFEVLADQVDKIGGLSNALVQQARIDLGVDRGSEPRLRSAWRRFKARRKLARLRAAYPALHIHHNTEHHEFVVIDRATGKRVIIAKTIQRLEDLLIERQLAQERGEHRAEKTNREAEDEVSDQHERPT